MVQLSMAGYVVFVDKRMLPWSLNIFVQVRTLSLKTGKHVSVDPAQWLSSPVSFELNIYFFAFDLPATSHTVALANSLKETGI